MEDFFRDHIIILATSDAIEYGFDYGQLDESDGLDLQRYE